MTTEPREPRDPRSIGVPEGAVAPAMPGDPARFPRTILPTVCIPWTEDLRVDVPLFQDMVRGRLANGIRYLYVFGTAGEGHAVTESQFDTIVRAAAASTLAFLAAARSDLSWRRCLRIAFMRSFSAFCASSSSSSSSSYLSRPWDIEASSDIR